MTNPIKTPQVRVKDKHAECALADEAKRLAQRAIVSGIHTALAAQSGLATEAKYDDDLRNLYAVIDQQRDLAGPEAPQWISVDERLPDTARRVLACNPLGYVGAATYSAGHWNGIGRAHGWMELPGALPAPPVPHQATATPRESQ